MVRQLYNHPSIFVWCCHNEPSFNRHELDPVLERALKEEDSSRFVDTASDFHFHPYPGWYWDDSAVRDVPGALGPETKFLSEFGAQALPSVASLKKMFKPGQLWPPDWKEWAFHDFQYFQTFNVARVNPGKSLAEFVENSQNHQAWLVKEYIQSIRLRKYKPMNGYFHFMFVDCWPAITWSVMDVDRIPKKGYAALKTASQPLLPLWRSIVTQFNPGDTISWGESLLEGVMLINDFPYGFKGLKVDLKLVGPRENVIFKDTGICNLGPDCIAKPFEGKVRLSHIKGFAIPKTAKPGEYQVRLVVMDRKGKKIAHNETPIQVVRKKF
jgi:beta-mannosidase